ncbi:UNVERIFIED_CONTAM: DEAD/DEAH box helicase family protein [Actinomycetes bacterium ARC8]|nr:DEAD/DEAH box helicase family protein [Actinomycetes bacterium ARC8]
MKFTLKDYQENAVRDALMNLADARDYFHGSRPRTTAFSLSAVTGAGKTVMAAAIIESVFHGNEDFDFPADPGAVILWFTDDKSLNEQTRFRILQASDKISYARVKVIGSNFHESKLQPGHVYFLNSQKLNSRSLLVRSGTEINSDDMIIPPDDQGQTFWEILRNTINDPALTLYVFLDEAHRGMRKRTKNESAEKSTIVRQLINGEAGAPAVPIVMGISATVSRFNTAMSEASGRTILPPVSVDPSRVQESGLLKDDIRLHFPTDSGKFDTVLLRRGVRQVREATDLWNKYFQEQDSRDKQVFPLLVVQVPNTPSEEMLTEAVQTILDAWPQLSASNIAHVFGGNHSDLDIAGHTIQYVSPEHVQERSSIRILLAKDAISTGWDCPRAEVLVSFRPAQDDTHITQLLGRMVRTPLARRVPGNDLLNSVECILPFFSRNTASHVVKLLLGTTDGNDPDSEGNDSGGGKGRRVLVSPVDMLTNKDIEEEVWDVFDLIPSETLPRKGARPTSRLSGLAQALAFDGILPGATNIAYSKLLSKLDGVAAEYQTELDKASKDISTLKGSTIVASLRTGVIDDTIENFTELADDRAVEDEYRVAGRLLGKEIASRYAERIADRLDDDDDGFYTAHLTTAALARVPGVKDELDHVAANQADSWFRDFRVPIKSLSDERKAIYADLMSMSGVPQTIQIVRPKIRTESSEDSEGNKVPTRTLHLMSDGDGNFPIGALGTWERDVLDRELPHAVAWYRNPARSDDALAIAYSDVKEKWHRLFPDLIFFQKVNGKIVPSIVDPHWHDLPDALPKLKGLANYAEKHAKFFHRVEAVSKIDGILRVIDLTKSDVRMAVRQALSAEELYRGKIAINY